MGSLYAADTPHDLDRSYRADEEPFPTRTDIVVPDRRPTRSEVENLHCLFFPRLWNGGDRVGDPEAIEECLAELADSFAVGIRAYDVDPEGIVPTVLDQIPAIRETLKHDVVAAYKGDPAAKSYREVIRSYPGFHALLIHRVAHALYEAGSWLLILNGAWIWIFSQHVPGPKPDFLFESVSLLTFGVVSFSGFPVVVGIAGALAALLGLVLLGIGEPPELAEFLSPIVNVISYARIMAVLLAKGGMALAVNLLAFGAYIGEGGEGSFHFIFTPSHLEYVQNHPDSYELVFAGMTTSPDMPIVGLVAGVLVAIVGHIVVLLLGITSAGIQGVRLEYVEFFGKFYEGGGEPYSPFGYDREDTANE